MNLEHVGTVKFPTPEDININMMPFHPTIKTSLPVEYQHYWPMIQETGEKSRWGLAYLTITESFVGDGKSQRRPGIHTEAHPDGEWGGGWGGGRNRTPDGHRTGIWMASNRALSCRAWDTYVDDIGPGGDCEHLRTKLFQSYAIDLRRNGLYWMTDHTPHEALPMYSDDGNYRQFFRLVAGPVDVWYAKHSTLNRIMDTYHALEEGRVKIIEGDKFE